MAWRGCIARATVATIATWLSRSSIQTCARRSARSVSARDPDRGRLQHPHIISLFDSGESRVPVLRDDLRGRRVVRERLRREQQLSIPDTLRMHVR